MGGRKSVRVYGVRGCEAGQGRGYPRSTAVREGRPIMAAATAAAPRDSSPLPLPIVCVCASARVGWG